MPHVSRHTPIKQVSDKTFDLFMQCVTSKWSSNERREFLDDLLTPTERIMFSKRLGIIYMLAKGYTFESIQETLRVSPSTVARLWSGIEKGHYRKIVSRVSTQTRQQADLVQWFSLLMPPRHQTRKQYSERLKKLGL